MNYCGEWENCGHGDNAICGETSHIPGKVDQCAACINLDEIERLTLENEMLRQQDPDY